MNPARSLLESWLFEAAQGALPGWKRALLLRALRRDAGLRRLALELLEFECEPAPDGPDLLPRLRRRLAEEAAKAERPLFPSAWIPAGAIAALLLTALVAVGVHPVHQRQGDASVYPTAGANPLPGGAQAQAAAPARATAPPATPAHPLVPQAASAGSAASAPSPLSAGASARGASVPAQVQAQPTRP